MIKINIAQWALGTLVIALCRITLIQAETRVECRRPVAGSVSVVHVCTAYVKDDEEYVLDWGTVDGEGELELEEVSNHVAGAAEPLDLAAKGFTYGTVDGVADLRLKKIYVVGEDSLTAYVVCKRREQEIDLNAVSVIWRIIYKSDYTGSGLAERRVEITNPPFKRPYLFVERVTYGDKVTISCPPSADGTERAVFPIGENVFVQTKDDSYSLSLKLSSLSRNVILDEARITRDDESGSVVFDFTDPNALLRETSDGENYYYYYCSSDPRGIDPNDAAISGVMIYFDGFKEYELGCSGKEPSLFKKEMNKMEFGNACVGNSAVESEIYFRCAYTLYPPLCGLDESWHLSNILKGAFEMTGERGIYKISLKSYAANSDVTLGCLCIDENNNKVINRVDYSTTRVNLSVGGVETDTAIEMKPGETIVLRCPYDSQALDALQYLEMQSPKDEEAIAMEKTLDYGALKMSKYGSEAMIWLDASGINFIKMQTLTVHCVANDISVGQLKTLKINVVYEELDLNDFHVSAINPSYINSVSLYQYRFKPNDMTGIDCSKITSPIVNLPALTQLYPNVERGYYSGLNDLDLSSAKTIVTFDYAFDTIGFKDDDQRLSKLVVSYEATSSTYHVISRLEAPSYLVCRTPPSEAAAPLDPVARLQQSRLVIVRLMLEGSYTDDPYGYTEDVVNPISEGKDDCVVDVDEERVFSFYCSGEGVDFSTCLDRLNAEATGVDDNPVRMLHTDGVYTFDFTSVTSIKETVTCECNKGDVRVGSLTVVNYGIVPPLPPLLPPAKVDKDQKPEDNALPPLLPPAKVDKDQKPEDNALLPVLPPAGGPAVEQRLRAFNGANGNGMDNKVLSAGGTFDDPSASGSTRVSILTMFFSALLVAISLNA